MNFNISNIDLIDTSILQTEFDKAIFEATVVFSKFKSTIPDFEKYKENWDKIFEVIFYSERNIRVNYLLDRTNEQRHNSLTNEDPDILFKFSRFTL